MVFEVLRQVTLGCESVLEFGVCDIASHDDLASERKAGLDRVFGQLCANCSQLANDGEGTPTGTITTVLKAPVPLNRVYKMVATVNRREGRKIFVDGTLSDGDTGQVFSTASTVQIVVPGFHARHTDGSPDAEPSLGSKL